MKEVKKEVTNNERNEWKMEGGKNGRRKEPCGCSVKENQMKTSLTVSSAFRSGLC